MDEHDAVQQPEVDAAPKRRVFFEPFPKQLDFINACFSGLFRYIFYGGAAGGGKTYAGIGLLILLCKLFPGSKWVVVRKDAEKLRLTSVPSFKKLCPPAFLKKFNESTFTAYFKNGSEILFTGQNLDKDPDLMKFDGLEVNGFLLEEVQELDVKMHHKANLRAGRHILPPDKQGNEVAQPPKLILHTGNPSHNWSKDMFYDPWEAGTLAAPFCYIPAKMEDNFALTQEYLDSLDTLDPITKARYVDGDWHISDVDMPFAYAFDKKKHVGEFGGPVFDQPLFLSFDFNVEPITCIVAQHNRYRTQVRIHREFRLGPSDIYKLCANIKKLYPPRIIDQKTGKVVQPGFYYVVTGDASGFARQVAVRDTVSLYGIIKLELGLDDSQLKTPNSNPAHKDNRILVNSLLSRHTDILFHRTLCKYAIEDMELCEVDSTGQIDKKASAYRTHLLDCVRYYFNTFFSDYVRYKS
jgi:hypothetical protein